MYVCMNRTTSRLCKNRTTSSGCNNRISTKVRIMKRLLIRYVYKNRTTSSSFNNRTTNIRTGPKVEYVKTGQLVVHKNSTTSSST